jgi:hypothetical protein
MNINSVNNDYNISMHGKYPNWVRRVGQWFLDKSPSHTSKESENSIKNWNKWTYITSDPMWNRGIMGATALLTQPAIDYYNHRVDDETRTVSRNRTVSKIVAGTLVGMFVVRGPVSKLVEKMTNVNGKKDWQKWLLPKAYVKRMASNPNGLKNYRSALSMGLALAAMCVTNFLLDAPLTIFFTNYLNKKSHLKRLKEEQKLNQTDSNTKESEVKNG